MQKVDEAIEMFKLNVGLYPNSPNVFDSLGKPLANAGSREEAIRPTSLGNCAEISVGSRGFE